MSKLTKRILHILGSFLAIVGIVFVVLRLNDYSSQIDFSRFDSLVWGVVISLALIYGLANILLALAWRSLLVYFGSITSRLWAVKIYGLTQLAKYIPSNIMHLASRQVMGQSAGISGWTLAKASVWELGTISISGTFFAILVLPQFLPILTASISVAAFTISTLLMVVVLKRYVTPAIAQAFAWYVLFLTTSGMVFVGVLVVLMDKGAIEFSSVLIFCGAFVVAWLVGLVTPGAPAGVGVRELVLLVLLKGLVLESDLLLAILLSRLVTVVGDVLFFLFASFLSYRKSA